jgi:hypothetical protein
LGKDQRLKAIFEALGNVTGAAQVSASLTNPLIATFLGLFAEMLRQQKRCVIYPTRE